MEFMESTRAKLIRALVGGPTFLISSLILILKMIVWYLIEFDSSWRYAWICFIFIVESTLLPNKVLKLLSRYVLYPLIPKFYENACYHELYPCFDLILGCLDVCLTCLDEMHVACYISILTLMSCDSAWKVVQVRTSIPSHGLFSY